MQHHPEAGAALRRVATIALLSVVLGFAVQGLILAIRLTDAPWGSHMIATAVGGVAWSVLVCAGVGVGTVLANGRALLTGLVALCVAPLSLAIAKGAQKMMAGWLGAAQQEAVLSLGTVSMLRAVEYGVLGWLLGRLVVMDRTRPWPYLRAGAGIGMGFGGLITALTLRAAEIGGNPLVPAAFATTAINEVAFPIGCALVIYLGQEVGRTLRLVEEAREEPSDRGPAQAA